MALPTYNPTQLTLKKITDDMVIYAMIDIDAGYLPLKEAKTAAYSILSHNAVWDDEFEVISEAMAAHDDDREPYDVCELLAKVVSDQMELDDEMAYREALDGEKVRLAALAAGVNPDTSIDAIPVLVTMLSILVVSGTNELQETERDNDILKYYGLTVEDVFAIADKYEEEEK